MHRSSTTPLFCICWYYLPYLNVRTMLRYPSLLLLPLHRPNQWILLVLTLVVWSNPSQAMIPSSRILSASDVMGSPAAHTSPPPSYSPIASSTKRKKTSKEKSWSATSPEPTRSPKADKKTKSPSVQFTESLITRPTSAPKKARPLSPSLAASPPELRAEGRRADTWSPTVQIVEKVDNVHLQPESVTFSIPLKTFELHLSRDRKWSSSFDDAHIQYTVEEFLGPSLDTPHSQGKNVTLKLQTVRCSQEMTECAYRFEGSYYYNVGVEQGVDPDEIWIQQLKVMMDPSLLQAAFDKNPYMAVARIRVQSVRFLDGSERGLPGGGEAGKYSNWTDTTHLILMAGCAGVVLVSILGTCAICMSFRNQEKVAEVAVKPPVPPTNSKTSRTSKSTNPTATIVVYHTDAPSVTSSITEQRGKDGLPNYPSYAMPYTLDRSICETLDIER